MVAFSLVYIYLLFWRQDLTWSGMASDSIIRSGWQWVPDPLACTSWVLGLHHYATMSGMNFFFVMRMCANMCVHRLVWCACVHVPMEAGSQFWVSSSGKLSNSFETEHLIGLELPREARLVSYQAVPQKASFLCLSKFRDSKSMPPCPAFSPGF